MGGPASASERGAAWLVLAGACWGSCELGWAQSVLVLVQCSARQTTYWCHLGAEPIEPVGLVMYLF